MSASTITYNDFVFPFTRLSVREEPRFDEDGLTLIGTDFDFSVTGWITADSIEAMRNLIREMRCKLKPRGKPFIVKWGPDGSLPEEQTNYYSFELGDDHEFGPHPGALTLENFSGGVAAAYTWSIHVFKKECYSDECVPANMKSEILSISRSWNHAIDANGMCTRTCDGILRLRSGTTENTADLYRPHIVPTIPGNYQRISQNFATSANGLELRFNFVDQEQLYTLPQPLTGGSANFSVRISDYGALATMTLSGYFEAPPNVQRAEILQRIAALAMEKFPTNAPGLVFESRELSSPVFSPNRIDFHITATAAAGVDPSGMAADFNIGLNELLAKPNESSGISQGIGPFGSSDAAITAPYPQTGYDACTTTSPSAIVPSSSGQTSSPATGGGAGPPANSAGSATNNDISDEHASTPYISYHERLSYEIDSGMVVFYPKDTGKEPILQQARPAGMRVIQAGYAVRFGTRGNVPKPPKPLYSPNAPFIVLNSFVDAANPEPVGDGRWSKYTIHWRYIMTFLGKFAVGNPVSAEPRFAADPRRTSTIDGGGTLELPTELIPLAPA